MDTATRRISRRSPGLCLLVSSLILGWSFQNEPSTLVIRVRAADQVELPGFPLVELFLRDRRISYGNCDSRGEYTFYNLREEQYQIRVRLSGFEPAIQDVPLQGGAIQNVYVNLHKREQLGPSALALQELTDGRRLRAAADLEGAIHHLKRAVEDSPRFSLGHLELGIYYWQNDQLDEAKRSFETAIEVTPNLLPAYLNLAEVLSQTGEVDRARDVCRRASEVHPDRSEPYYVAARALLNANRFDEAEQAAHAALERDHGTIPKLYLLIAGFYQRNNEPDKEIEALEAFLARAPDNPQNDPVRDRIATIREEQTFEASAKLYFDVIESYRGGNFGEATSSLSQIPARSVIKAVERLRKNEAADDGLVLSAVLLHSEAAMLPGFDRSFHVGRAAVLLNAVRDEATRRRFERRWCLALGYYFQKQDSFLNALPFFTEAVKNHPGDVEVGLSYGSVCETICLLHGFDHLLDQAEKQYRLILETQPRHPEANLRLGHVLKHQGRGDEASIHLETVLAAADQPDQILIANLLLGDIHRARGDLLTAIDFYQAALDTGRRCQAATVALSHALHQARFLHESTELLKRFLNEQDAVGRADDAWWNYLRGHSNRFESMMEELHSEVLR